MSSSLTSSKFYLMRYSMVKDPSRSFCVWRVHSVDVQTTFTTVYVYMSGSSRAITDYKLEPHRGERIMTFAELVVLRMQMPQLELMFNVDV